MRLSDWNAASLQSWEHLGGREGGREGRGREGGREGVGREGGRG